MRGINKERLGWIIIASALLAIAAVVVWGIAGGFRRPASQPSPTPRAEITLTVTVSRALTGTATFTPTAEGTRASTATPFPGGSQEIEEPVLTATPVPTAVSSNSGNLLNPSPTFRPESPNYTTPTETPISLEGGVEAGFP